MSDKDSAQNVIDSYRKRQSMARRAPLIFGVAAVLLIAGAAILIFWLANRDQGGISFLSPTATPTSTSTSTATPEPTATNTPTETPTLEPSLTPTASETPTATGPFVYTVQEGDLGLSPIAAKFGTTVDLILALNPNIDPTTLIIYVGQQIIIPGPNTTLPTATLIPTDFRGNINYTVQPGDSLLSIAVKFNSTTDAILKENKDKLKTVNDVLYAGWILIIPVNLVTPAPTATVGTVYPTAVIPPTNTPTPTATKAP
jgi:LysM repeat protein